MRHGLLRFGHETRKPKGVEDLALDGLPHALTIRFVLSICCGSAST